MDAPALTQAPTPPPYGAYGRPLVLYHARCPDGWVAAWVWHAVFPDSDFQAVSYGCPPPNTSGRFTYILDFSYPPNVLAEICRSATFVVVLDHHATAKAALAAVSDELSTIHRMRLPNGDDVIIDCDDAHKLSAYSWSRSSKSGVMAYTGGGRAKSRYIYMHRLIMDAPKNLLVDHRNRNVLDNRKKNLRLATRQGNAANMDRGSAFKGVTRKRTKWIAQITVRGRNHYLGSHDSPEAAAAAYDAEARKRFGEFARCNFEGDTHEPFPANCHVMFDLKKSGARLTWEYLAVQHRVDATMPLLVAYVEDGDLWAWKLPFSREVNAYLSTLPHDFAAWSQAAALLGAHPDEPVHHDNPAVVRGRSVLDAHERSIESHAEQAFETELDGHRVLAVNCTSADLHSELVGKLAAGRPFAIGWFVRKDGAAQVSLRSRDSGFDVSQIAKRHGGGGHVQAAGFQVPSGQPLPFSLPGT